MKYKKRKSTGLSRKQRKAVTMIAKKVVDEEIEDKAYTLIQEDIQLFHNKPGYAVKLLQQIVQGISDGDQGTGLSGIKACRIGSQISLKNMNIRLWVSNKLDRPNVMYKGILFWYSVAQPPTDATVYLTQSNKMLDRYNTKDIQIVDTFILTSKNNYAQPYQTQPFPVIAGPGILGREHSQLVTLNKSYKNRKITYDELTGLPKIKELGFSVVCYDAKGTLQTDNIASFAYNMTITFQDA